MTGAGPSSTPCESACAPCQSASLRRRQPMPIRHPLPGLKSRNLTATSRRARTASRTVHSGSAAAVSSWTRVLDRRKQRARELLAVRGAARAALLAQLDGAGRQSIEDTQRRLNAVYDRFVFRFGPLNAAPNATIMGSDPDAFFLRALECWDTAAQQRHQTGRPVTEAAARERLKMPLFREIVVRQAQPATSTRSPKDAFLLVLNERGTLDFARMAELLGPGTTPESVCDTLVVDGLIFEDPEAGWQTADAYLSGNVKRKLAIAERAALAESRFQGNVEALRLVIPADITPGQNDVRLGTHWIPATDVNDFLREVLHAEEPRWSRSGGHFVHYVALSRAEAPDPVYLHCEHAHDVSE